MPRGTTIKGSSIKPGTSTPPLSFLEYHLRLYVYHLLDHYAEPRFRLSLIIVGAARGGLMILRSITAAIAVSGVVARGR